MDSGKNTYRTIDEYILTFPGKAQEKLREMRAVIKEVAPEAEETISYQMPAFRLKGILVYFAAFQHHIGFYPTGGVLDKFEKEVAPYKRGKGSIQFPMDEPLPLELIRKIVKFWAAENLRKAKEKSGKKGKALQK
jgi:uncharacterized protein YdhG (YjbR/CyaY superfamily)